MATRFLTLLCLLLCVALSDAKAQSVMDELKAKCDGGDDAACRRYTSRRIAKDLSPPSQKPAAPSAPTQTATQAATETAAPEAGPAPSATAPQSLAAIYRELQDACARNNVESCDEAKWFEGRYRIELRLEDLKTRCDGGDASACRRHKSLIFESERQQVDRVRWEEFEKTLPARMSQDQKKRLFDAEVARADRQKNYSSDRLRSSDERQCLTMRNSYFNARDRQEFSEAQRYLSSGCALGCRDLCNLLSTSDFSSQVRHSTQRSPTYYRTPYYYKGRP